MHLYKETCDQGAWKETCDHVSAVSKCMRMNACSKFNNQKKWPKTLNKSLDDNKT